MEMATRDVQSADSWVDAAYRRFVDDGLAAVRIEALARDLGTTKGSFYWHFTDRHALIDAVMARWEREETEQIIAVADGGGAPAERLALLFETVSSHARQRGGEATLYVAAEAEGVQGYVARVSQRRAEYVAAVLESAGFGREEAYRRGVISLSVALGMQQLTVGGAPQLITAAGPELARTALSMTLSR